MSESTYQKVDAWISGRLTVLDETREGTETIETLEGERIVPTYITTYRLLGMNEFPGNDIYMLAKVAISDGRISLRAYAFGWPVVFTSEEIEFHDRLWEEMKPSYVESMSEEEQEMFYRDALRRIFRNKARYSAMKKVGIDLEANPTRKLWYRYLQNLPKDLTIVLGDEEVQMNREIARMRFALLRDLIDENMSIVTIPDSVLDNMAELMLLHLPEMSQEQQQALIQKMTKATLLNAFFQLNLNDVRLTPIQAILFIIILTTFGAEKEVIAPYDSFLAIHASKPEISRDFVARYRNELPIAFSAKENLINNE